MPPVDAQNYQINDESESEASISQRSNDESTESESDVNDEPIDAYNHYYEVEEDETFESNYATKDVKENSDADEIALKKLCKETTVE